MTAAVAARFDEIADVYDSVVDYFGRFGVRLVAAADLREGADVLDLACGRGAVLLPALDAVGGRGSVLGIDVAPAMVSRLGAELTGREVTNAAVRVGDAAQLDLPDASFDAVTGGFMIFFPPEPHRVLAEVRRVLRPGGRVALSIYDGPTGFPFQSELEAAVGATPRAASPGRAFNEVAVLTSGLAEAGLVAVETIAMGERFEFESVDQVERWQRSMGTRTVLAALDDQQLDAYRIGLASRLEAFRVASGRFVLEQRAVAAVAVAPP